MSKKSVRNLFLGAAIGASLGILFAPKKGKETRRDLKNKMLNIILFFIKGVYFHIESTANTVIISI